MDSVDPSALRIPAILMTSYNNVMQTPSGRADLKRISVRCGICRLVRYYSLTRGITRINGVVACEACRHCYQAYKRDPVPLHCTKGDGSCWLGLVFPKTKCRCCWLTQMLENTPIPQHLYTKFIVFLPHYIKSLLRGRPVQASILTLEQRGCLALEVHTGTDWKDVTDSQAVELQRAPLQDRPIDEQETEVDDSMDGRPPAALPRLEERPTEAAVPSPAHQGVASLPLHSSAPLLPRSAATATTTMVESLAAPKPPMRGQKAVKRTASKVMRGGGMSAALSSRIQPLMLQPENKSNSSSSDSLSMDTTSSTSGASNMHAKATKRSRGGRFCGVGGGSVRGKKRGGGVNKIDRLMAGIKEGLYGINIGNDASATDAKKKTPTSSSNSGVASAGQSSGVPSSSNNSSSESSEETSAVPSPAAAPHIEDDVTVEEEFEEAISQLPPVTSKTPSVPAQLKDKKLPDSMSGLLHAEQKKYLKDFNPRNSARVRRKKDRVEYFDTTKIQRVYETMVHDHKGRFVASDRSVHDGCDCLQGDCPGCHFPCPKCRSTKCGAECRSNRKWYYERVDVEGTDQFYVNRFSSAK